MAEAQLLSEHFRPSRPMPDPLGRIGTLETRLARNARELRCAQALRYEVFCKEMSARPHQRSFDADRFDAVCDHLLVIDRAAPGRSSREAAIVGTYRLLRQEAAERSGGFYSSGEFEIGELIERHRALDFLELGRSCVLAPYRNRRALELLWVGIWAYARHFGTDVMIGCASFQGTDPDRLALPLSFLHHHARAPAQWQVRARAERRIPMNRMPAESIDARQALNALPPLLKGYLRLGAFIGDGAVVDQDFGTTDVFVVLPVSAIRPRYFGRFGAPAATLSEPQPLTL